MPTAANKKRSAPSRGSTTAEAPAAKKRKSDANMQKFYAVRAGKKPGVYLTWPECQAQTAGFRGAAYKSFTSREDAEAFVAGKNPKVITDGEPQPEKYYAVAKAAVTGIFTDWDTVSLAIKGIKGPKYKKFGTMVEAFEFIKQWGDEGTIAKAKRQLDGLSAGTSKTAPKPAVKKNAKVVEEAQEDGQDFLDIYTDGSALANGKSGAVAGVGVFFGVGDPRNISEKLKGDPQTNQRAELTAILRALEIADLEENVQIFTDSQYAINCVVAWAPGWEKKGWMTAQGEEVKNQDLIKAIRERLQEREVAGTQTIFKWVKGHATDAGNSAADALAVQGAKAAKKS